MTHFSKPQVQKVEDASATLRRKFPKVFNSLFYSFLVLNGVVTGFLIISAIVIDDIRSFEQFVAIIVDPSDEWVTGYLLVFVFNVMFIYGAIQKRNLVGRQNSEKLYREAVARVMERRANGE